jgi:hypothetical protein
VQVSDRLIGILKLARRVKFLNRKIIQEELFPNDADGSVTREYLRKMKHAGLLHWIDRTSEYHVQTAPIYTCTEAGCCLLATHMGDMRWLLDCAANTRNAQDFPHHLGVSRLLIPIEKAIAGQQYVECVKSVTEHDIVNPDAEPAKRIRLYTEAGQNQRGGKVICIPDFALLVRVRSFFGAYYFEFETGADGSPSRVLARKQAGYRGLLDSKKFLTHFPQAQQMRVVFVCPNTGWREAMRKEAQEMNGQELWLFVVRDDITPETFLHGDIFFTPTTGPRPLVKRAPAGTPGTAPAQEPGGGVR